MVPYHCCNIYNSAFPPAGSTFKKAILQISGKRICWNSSEENESWHAARQNSLSTGACLPNPSSKEVVSTGEPWLSIHITVNHRKKWTMKNPCRWNLVFYVHDWIVLYLILGSLRLQNVGCCLSKPSFFMSSNSNPFLKTIKKYAFFRNCSCNHPIRSLFFRCLFGFVEIYQVIATNHHSGLEITRKKRANLEDVCWVMSFQPRGIRTFLVRPASNDEDGPS